MAAVPPLMLKTDANPGGLPIEVFDGIRAGVAADRSQFFKDLTTPFYGANRPGAKVSQGVRDAFWFQGMQGGLKNELDCIKAFSETDFTGDLRKFDVPTLIIHGDDDQIVPIGASAHAASRLVKHATLKVYPGGSHGLADTHKDELNAEPSLERRVDGSADALPERTVRPVHHHAALVAGVGGLKRLPRPARTGRTTRRLPRAPRPTSRRCRIPRQD